MLKRVSFDWENIVDSIELFSSDFQNFKADNIDLNWYLVPKYPACKMIDLAHYFDLEKITLGVIRFVINTKDSNFLRVSLTIEDKERSLLKRRLKSDVDAYDGTPLVLEFSIQSQSQIYQEYFLTLSQRINLEMDSGFNCLNYPSKEFQSYRDCDEDYVYHQMKQTYKIMPFWAANTLDEVTSLMWVQSSKPGQIKTSVLRSYNSSAMAMDFDNLFDGTVESNCPKPCKSTKVSTIQDNMKLYVVYTYYKR